MVKRIIVAFLALAVVGFIGYRASVNYKAKKAAANRQPVKLSKLKDKRISVTLQRTMAPGTRTQAPGRDRFRLREIF